MLIDDTAGRNTSAEILRLALQRMSQHEAGFHPACYAVWYEYLSGSNPQLNQAVDAWTARGLPLDDAAIEHFYQGFLSECNVEKMLAMREDAQRILRDISVQAEQAGSRAHRYDDHLQQSASRLDAARDADSLRDVVTRLREDTSEMHAAMQALQEHLQQSREEIEALRRELETVRSEVLTDPLTGVLNRRGFFGRLEGMLKEGRRPCLLMLDIDHFKNINDSYGHLFGDKVIRVVAHACETLAGHAAAVARLGGEEFAVLLPEAPLEAARALAETVRLTVENGKIRSGGNRAPVGGITVSIGVTAHLEGEAHASFIDRADRALYLSKQNGRNRTTVLEA